MGEVPWPGNPEEEDGVLGPRAGALAEKAEALWFLLAVYATEPATRCLAAAQVTLPVCR